MLDVLKFFNKITPFKNKKKGKSNQESFIKSKTYYFGDQDEMDFISYAGLLEQSTYLKINNRYVRTLLVTGYPYVASTGWLNMLINFNHNIDISYHIEQVDPISALPKLNRKITELESVRRSMQKEGKVIGSEITDPLESAVELKDKIQRGQEKLFQISIYMNISSETLSELNKLTTLLETVMSTRLFYIKNAVFQQIEGLQSILPRAQNQLGQKRNLDSSSAALTFPFVSSEFVQESGILYGINKSNNSLVIVDRFALTNANSIIFAQSGSGKSFTAKVEILRQLMQGTRVIVIDPEREYQQLTKSVKGTYIHLAAKSKEKINPFDFSIHSYTDENNLAEHIQDLTEIIALMADGLSSEERADVDKALVETYKLHGFTLSGKQTQNQPPLLKDFYERIKRKKGAQKAIVAAARKLLVIVFHILTKKEVFQYHAFPRQAREQGTELRAR